ncbi:MAG TPA: phosphatase PAP2 family protein [Ignavibacteriaceae bacterium]|nr:phosphatase PAP2 family protein [Ignavibacteriaceae bacterium]
MPYFLSLIFLLQFLNFVSFAQTSGKIKIDVKDFFKVGGDIFTAPAHFDKTDLLNLSGTIVLTGGSFFIDEQIKDFSQTNKSSFLDNLFEIDKYYHWESMAVSIAGIYTYGLAAEDKDVRNLAVQLSEATFYASLINLTAKFIAGRARPYMNMGNTDFEPFNFTWEHSSTPSGHTTLSFAYSTIMADVYKNFFWKFGWYSAAVLVGFARIYHNVHWFSDTVLGAAIGYFVGNFVRNHSINQKIQNMPQNQNLSVSFHLLLP